MKVPTSNTVLHYHRKRSRKNTRYWHSCILVHTVACASAFYMCTAANCKHNAGVM